MYRLLGIGGAEAEALPSANQPMWSTAGCHIRAGAHDLTEYGWLQFLDFAARMCLPPGICLPPGMCLPAGMCPPAGILVQVFRKPALIPVQSGPKRR